MCSSNLTNASLTSGELCCSARCIPEPCLRIKTCLTEVLCDLYFYDSCVSGSDKKLENSVDLFGEIDPKVTPRFLPLFQSKTYSLR